MTSRFSLSVRAFSIFTSNAFDRVTLAAAPGRRGGVNTELTCQAFVAKAVRLRRDQKRCHSLFGGPRDPFQERTD